MSATMDIAIATRGVAYVALAGVLLAAAITLNAASINIARAIGPALGGFIVAASGPWAVFLLNAASFIGIMFVVYRWQPAPRKSNPIRQTVRPLPRS